MVRDTPPSQYVSTHQIWNSYLKEYRRYGPDTKAGRTDGRTVRLLYASQSSFGGIKKGSKLDPLWQIILDPRMSYCLAHLSQTLLKRANSRGLVHSSKIRMSPLNNQSISTKGKNNASPDQTTPGITLLFIHIW